MSTPTIVVVNEDPAHIDMWEALDEAMDEVMDEAAGEGMTLSDLLNSTPQGRAALERARARAARAIDMPCPWGWCINEYDPVDRVIIGGFGPMACPCENLPGWRAEHPAGRAKPQVPAKALGRHGSRVQRSTVRHALPDYDIDDFAWLPPCSTASKD